MSLNSVWQQAIAYLNSQLGDLATITGEPLTFPITVGPGNQFSFTTPDRGHVFNIPEGTYTRIGDFAQAVSNAPGNSDVFGVFGDYVAVAVSGDSLKFTDYTNVGSAGNSDLLTNENGGGVLIGLPSTTYFSGGSGMLPFVKTIFQYPEIQTPDSVFFPADEPGITTGVAIWSWMSDGEESRIATGPNGPPPQGVKYVPYLLHLNCVLRGAYQTNGVGDSAQLTARDNTLFIESLKNTIRYSRNAGGSPVGIGTSVFQWGEGQSQRAGSPDIKWHSDSPVMLQGAGVAGIVEIRTRFDVWISETVNS